MGLEKCVPGGLRRCPVGEDEIGDGPGIRGSALIVLVRFGGAPRCLGSVKGDVGRGQLTQLRTLVFLVALQGVDFLRDEDPLDHLQGTEGGSEEERGAVAIVGDVGVHPGILQQQDDRPPGFSP